MSAPQERSTPPDADAPRTVRIVLADDHPVLRSNVRLLLDREPDFEVLADAGDLDSARRYVRGQHPDVLVAELNMPDGSGLEAIPRLRDEAPHTQIVMLTVHNEPALARQALRAGALAYVLKQASGGELIKAVRLAASGRPYLDPQLGARIATEPASRSSDELSDRELQVLRGIAQGHRDSQIAAQLHVSLTAAEETRRHIQTKLGLRTRRQLVGYTLARGLLDRNDR
jgi:two-component system, NarL family, response regulator NreC